MNSYLWILILASLAGTWAQDLNLSDALDDEPTPPPAKVPPKTGGDATPEVPKKPAGDPSKTEGTGGGFSDSDLSDVAGNGEYKPDAGRGGSKGRASGPAYDSDGGDAEPQAPQGGQMAGIISAVGVAILGAASSYFAYQKKKLCFKMQGGTDPESGVNHAGTQSEPQVLSNLLKSP